MIDQPPGLQGFSLSNEHTSFFFGGFSDFHLMMMKMNLPARLMVKSLSLPSLSSNVLEEIASTRKGVAKVVLKKGKTQHFRDGSPMVYSGAVDRIIGRPPPKTGDSVLVADGTEKPIGWGLYNSISMFCVRLMQLEEEARRDPSCALNVEKLLETRIDAAVDLRKNLGLPSENTNAYRLINSEGDRLSGLIVDMFGNVAVVASSAAWVEKYKSEIECHISLIKNVKSIKWRPSIDILKEEGLVLSHQNDDTSSPSIGTVKVMENGICYAVSLDGQKTGFYTDQRDSRHFISTISKGQKVLDICCYTGVDSSLPALEIAKENVIFNELNPNKVQFVREDATEYMKRAASRHETWDLVILDPPKLAPRKKVLQNASGMYRNLNTLAMRLTKKGGLLMTCSCSGAMTQSGMLLHILQGAASAAGRKITVVREAGAACDHPIDPSYPEGAYLTNYLLRVL